LLALAGTVHAADAYPSRPIHILVGFPPGGAVDAVARAIGQSLSTSLGQAVVVDNKPGASMNIAVRSLIDAAPDGYTLMLAANSLASNMALFNPPPFDAEKDVAPVALVGRIPVVIACNPNAPFKTLADLVKDAKANPGTIQYATPGNGSTPHLAIELFSRTAGIKLMHIPYKGGAPAITDVMGGQLPLVGVNALEVVPHAKAGKLRVLATMGSKRSAMLPDVPTIAESGYPGFEASVWYGVIAPAKTPPEIVAKLTAAIEQGIAGNEVKSRLAAVGGEATYGSPQQFATLIHGERIRYEKVVREGNIRPD
jgi:tripartite-type tricarboxylate transporter receptor subunit TctC